jgi:hypothetical protein
MKKNLNNSSTRLILSIRWGVNRGFFLALTLVWGLVSQGLAQEGSQGNTTIFANRQMTFFGNHNFVTGGSGAQPGVILTERTTASISYLNFSGNGLTATGGDDANYVDGYVRKYGTGQFIFPVGDNGNYGPFAANADGTSGAYFRGNASTAVTTNLFTGNNYAALPAGGPFPTTSKAADIATVSIVEYWDIDGTAASKISLTWDATSGITTLTGSDLAKLSIVGWNPSTSLWEKIASAVDGTSVLGGASSLAAGSISTTSDIVPNSYTAYTLASEAEVPDLTPTIDIDDLSFSNGQIRDFTVNIFEILGQATSGTVSFRVSRLTGWDITVPGITLSASDQSGVVGTSNVGGSTTHENEKWLFKQNSGFIIMTLKSGNLISANGAATLGFVATRKSGTPNGTLQNITVTIVNGSGSEVNFTNNMVITSISAN